LRGHAAFSTPLPWELEAYRKVKNLKKKNKRRSSSEMEWTVTRNSLFKINFILTFNLYTYLFLNFSATVAGPSGGAPAAAPNSTPAAPPTACPNCYAGLVLLQRCQALMENVQRTLVVVLAPTVLPLKSYVKCLSLICIY
jgi:hypothetical protein